uniref:D-glycero-alpha-D-manno-heptose 1-phosphate guanylyltransferase n=1 Tax=Aneurinibacillus thermoaerophilus TaxID=143495 RepID=HDDC_ANETH|nr:RecName: Full=D-glycero-alpha-D-manno-heptose 1-phosphate guanylyltransferase; AltName: Full=D-alpha-D-heptose 1-phosphate guanylyltransferase [Aneurinibacillus thermoaerophilus]AAK27852.1 D-glycero-D-manno-heptose 1-phosphate guanosyltransferase [Aneurinibacillus thermoaerophilus]
MEAIILVGGLGKRLRSVVSELPKPMAPIDNKPFLHYIFWYLNKQGIDQVILSTGYKHEMIETYFGNRYHGISINYSIEQEPLGTGGAIKKAFRKTTEENVVIINGDTLFLVDLRKMFERHISFKADLTLALKPMKEFERYGTVITRDSRVIAFKEKGYHSEGNINGGVYIANKAIFECESLSEKFSFEQDFLEKEFLQKKFYGFISDAYFIDIGIPDDYRKAQKELQHYI